MLSKTFPRGIKHFYEKIMLILFVKVSSDQLKKIKLEGYDRV